MAKKCGAKPLELDRALIEELASIHCSMGEIARIAGCSIDTLERRYMDVIEVGRANVKASLRRKQYELAMTGDRTMLVWLGKIILGQREPAHIVEHTAVEVKSEDIGLIADHLRAIQNDKAT